MFVGRESIIAVAALLAGVQPCRADEQLDACLLARLREAQPEMTVQAVRAACQPSPPVAETSAPAQAAKPPALITRRLAAEAKLETGAYTIIAHRPNYLLLASMNERRPSSEPFARDHSTETAEAQKVEAKYQLSLKAPVLHGLFDGDDAIYAAYTQRSFWQVYNRRASAPFRETDYEPEVWYQHAANRNILGWNLNSVLLGVNHQSNGRSKDFSRSWNRVFAAAAFERGNVAMVLRPWIRVTEDPSNDDNRDITHYLGNFDLTMIGKAGGHSWDLMVRNNLRRHGNRGATQFGWSFPLSTRFRGYVQWFKGYGESLIDYNNYQNTVGVGVMLTDW